MLNINSPATINPLIYETLARGDDTHARILITDENQIASLAVNSITRPSNWRAVMLTKSGIITTAMTYLGSVESNPEQRTLRYAVTAENMQFGFTLSRHTHAIVADPDQRIISGWQGSRLTFNNPDIVFKSYRSLGTNIVEYYISDAIGRNQQQLRGINSFIPYGVNPDYRTLLQAFGAPVDLGRTLDSFAREI